MNPMEQVIQQIPTSAMGWWISLILAIFSVTIGIWTWVKGKKIKQFTYKKDTNPIYENRKRVIGKLKVSYGNKEVSNLSITRIGIWNSGNEVINGSDMSSGMPLSIQINDSSDFKCEILDCEVVFETDETNKIAIGELEATKTTFNFEYIEPKNGFIIQVVHTGKQENISIGGKIKGGTLKVLEKDSKSLTSRQKSRRKIILTILVSIEVIFLNFLAGIAVWSIISLYPFSKRYFVFIVLFVASTIYVDVALVRMVIKQFRLSVPYRMRNEMRDT